MAEVIRNTTSKWRDNDRDAAIDYLKNLPPVLNRISKPKASGVDDY